MSEWKPGDSITQPCAHAVPQADSCLHGVCIFCYRDRGGKLTRENATLTARVKELEDALGEILECNSWGSGSDAMADAIEEMHDTAKAALAKLGGTP